MDAMKTVKLLQKYNKCPLCGSEKVGKGAGKVIIEDDKFHRSCKCGWEVNTDALGKEIKG